MQQVKRLSYICITILATPIFIACHNKKIQLTGDWNFVYNWSKSPKLESNVVMKLTSDSFFVSEQGGNTSGRWFITGDSIFLKITKPTVTDYKGIISNDSLMEGMMINYQNVGYWKASRISLNQ